MYSYHLYCWCVHTVQRIPQNYIKWSYPIIIICLHEWLIYSSKVITASVLCKFWQIAHRMMDNLIPWFEERLFLIIDFSCGSWTSVLLHLFYHWRYPSLSFRIFTLLGSWLGSFFGYEIILREIVFSHAASFPRVALVYWPIWKKNPQTQKQWQQNSNQWLPASKQPLRNNMIDTVLICNQSLFFVVVVLF